MNNFSTGIVCGAILGVGVALTVHPISKKEMHKMCCRANKAVRRAERMLRMG